MKKSIKIKWTTPCWVRADAECLMYHKLRMTQQSAVVSDKLRNWHKQWGGSGSSRNPLQAAHGGPPRGTALWILEHAYEEEERRSKSRGEWIGNLRWGSQNRRHGKRQVRVVFKYLKGYEKE